MQNYRRKLKKDYGKKTDIQGYADLQMECYYIPDDKGTGKRMVFYVWLLTKRKNECKQCQKEETKGHHILKIKYKSQTIPGCFSI